MPTYLPQMTQEGLAPTAEVKVTDEYQNIRTLHIAEERPLTIYIDSHEIVTLMTLGQSPELLALGYLKNQGLIDDLRQIQSIQVDWDVHAVAITTTYARDDWQQRLGSRIVTTGCGQGTIYANMLDDLEPVESTGGLKQSDLYRLLKALGRFNKVYAKAGAVHSCALCTVDKPLTFVEDVGRHNAVDMIAGQMWLEDIVGQNTLFYTTGRLTSEMVIKVANMQIPVLISRSGVSNMGLRLAKQLGVMLIARAKQRHFLIYSGAERMIFDTILPEKLFVAGVKTD